MSDQLPQKIKKGSISVAERLQRFNETEYFAVLATQDIAVPYTSLVAYAVTPDLKRLVFSTTRGTRKYKNILNAHGVALLIDNRPRGNKGLMKAEAITVLGIARPVRKGKLWGELTKIFLNKHPDFEGFIKAPSTVLMAVEIAQCVHVGRFQTVTTWDVKGIN
jgi:heme iron utilization protein